MYDKDIREKVRKIKEGKEIIRMCEVLETAVRKAVARERQIFNTEKNKLIAEYDKLIAQYDNLIAEKDKLIAEYKKLIAEKEYIIEERRNQIVLLRKSTVSESV